MSIMRLESVEGGLINSRYIDSLDLTIQCLGGSPMDVLVQVLHGGGVFYVALHHVPLYGTVVLPNIATYQTPFSLLLVTNINSYSMTALTVYAKLNGCLVSSYSQEDFHRLH